MSHRLFPMRVVVPAILLVILLTWPLLIRPAEILASPLGEADNHLWMHWQAAHPGGPWANLPLGHERPLMDVVNLPSMFLGFGISPSAAFNGTWVLCVALALFGGAILGWTVTRRTLGSLVGMTVLGGSPFLHGMGIFGMTEAWPIGWLAIAAASLLEVGRHGRLPWACLAALSSTAFMMSGWYNAFFFVLCAPFWIAWSRSRSTDWSPRRWLLFAGIVSAAAIPVIARLPSLWSHRSLWSSRWGLDVTRPDNAGWRLGPDGGGADLLQLITPSIDSASNGHSVYLGLTTLGCSALGLWWAWSSRQPKRWGPVWPAMGCAFVLTLSLGPTLAIAGIDLGLVLPARALTWLFSPLEGITHWYRATGPAVVFLAALAPIGVCGLLDALGNSLFKHIAILGLLTVDGLALSTNPWPRPHYDPRPPADLVALPGGGGLVLLPFDNHREEFSQEIVRIYDRWGPWLARPLSEHYEGPDALLAQNRLISAANAACHSRGKEEQKRHGPREFADASALSPSIVQGALQALSNANVNWIVLLPNRAELPYGCRDVLEASLGEPTFDTPSIAAWPVSPVSKAPVPEE